MAASFSIVVERRRNLLRVTLAGFFDIEEANRLRSAIHDAILSIPGPPNQHCTLYNVEGCSLQAQSIVAAFQEMLRETRFYSRRLAFVTADSLARMQVRRIIAGRVAGVFETEAAAMEWLFEEEQYEATNHAALAQR